MQSPNAYRQTPRRPGENRLPYFFHFLPCIITPLPCVTGWLLAGGAPQPTAQQPQQQPAAAAAAGQQGAAAQGEQQAGADGEKPPPPPDTRTWWQKNWLFVVAGGTMVRVADVVSFLLRH